MKKKNEEKNPFAQEMAKASRKAQIKKYGGIALYRKEMSRRRMVAEEKKKEQKLSTVNP